MSNLKVGLVAVVLLGGGFFAWLRQHDETVRWRSMAEQRQDSLTKKDEHIKGFRVSVESLGVAVARHKLLYTAKRRAMEDTVKKLLVTIDEMQTEVLSIPDLPPAARAGVVNIVNSCKQLESRMRGQLSDCETLNRELDSLSTKKDTLIWSLEDARDDWQKEAEEATSRVGGRTKTWVTVATNALTAIVSFFVGKKSD
jgi:uncharacterized protein HemX